MKLDATVYFSIPFLTLEKSKLFEPYAPKPEVRFTAMKTLADAGISVGIAVAPIIPTYNDSDIPALLQRARECGATRAFMTMLRLPTESLQTYFISRLQENAPTKADKILNQIKRERGGKLNNSEFGTRMSGKTEQWQLAVKMFDLHYKRLGFGQYETEPKVIENQLPVQQSLFE
jgi:DNA repair photolyase